MYISFFHTVLKAIPTLYVTHVWIKKYVVYSENMQIHFEVIGYYDSVWKSRKSILCYDSSIKLSFAIFLFLIESSTSGTFKWL